MPPKQSRRDALVESILDTVRFLLSAYDFGIPWPTMHGKAIKRLKRLMVELDEGENGPDEEA